MRRRWPALVLLAALASAACAPAPAGTPDAADLDAGRSLYRRYCATCHGDEGRGDGPSAGGLATRPSDFTDGRRLNRVPDEFLRNVILDGGPAEGLSPAMPPFRAFLEDRDVTRLVAYLRSLARPPFTAATAAPAVTVPGAPRQPIFFSHLVHAGAYQIPCLYCHSDARRSDYAGLPSVERCLGCHRVIGAQDNPEIQKIHDYARRGEPIPWVRVFKVPEYVKFPHEPHVRAGLACQTCHGPVERMRVVGARTGRTLANDLLHVIGLRVPPPPLTMGWCIECHRAENAARGAQAPLDCLACHH